MVLNLLILLRIIEIKCAYPLRKESDNDDVVAGIITGQAKSELRRGTTPTNNETLIEKNCFVLKSDEIRTSFK